MLSSLREENDLLCGLLFSLLTPFASPNIELLHRWDFINDFQGGKDLWFNQIYYVSAFWNNFFFVGAVGVEMSTNNKHLEWSFLRLKEEPSFT